MHQKASLVVTDFATMDEAHRLPLLLEYADKLPDLPARFGENPELLERVTECQSPVFIAVEGNRDHVQLYFSAPAEAPTTRGFASVLHSALDGLPAQEILELPEGFIEELRLTKLVSPLRMRGMSGMLNRIRRRVNDLT